MKIEIVEQQFDPWQQVVDYKRDKLLNDPRELELHRFFSAP